MERRQAINSSSLGASTGTPAIVVTAANPRRTTSSSRTEASISTFKQRQNDLHGRLSPTRQVQRRVPSLVMVGNLGGMRLDPCEEFSPVPNQRILIQQRGRSAHNGRMFARHPDASPLMTAAARMSRCPSSGFIAAATTNAVASAHGITGGGVGSPASTRPTIPPSAADVRCSVGGGGSGSSSPICQHGRATGGCHRGPPESTQFPTHG